MKICFVAHFAYGAISGGQGGHAGGVERQVSRMGRWLAGRGHEVSILTWDEGQGGEVRHDGVRVIGMCRQTDGLPGMRFFHPRWTSLMRAMATADSEIYYQNTAEYVTGQVALWCRRNGRSFVFSAASDADCDPGLPWLTKFRERVLYRYGLRNADGVIVQTGRQAEMLRYGFGIPSTVLPLPCPGPDERQLVQPSVLSRNPKVLWVGRIHPVKRLEMLLDVAAGLPGIEFVVAGKTDGDRAYTDPLIRRAEGMPNVRIIGMVPREEMPELYRSVSLLCCTSDIEGFPNVFLESWSHGLPVVSTFDPDDLIHKRGLGMTAGDAGGLIEAIRTLLGDDGEWRRMSGLARSYYLENHTEEAVMLRFEGYFENISSRFRKV